MASHGIRDQVAIVGMGCTTFGEHWDRSTDDLLIDASSEALALGRRHARRRRRLLARHDGLRALRAHAQPAAEDRPQAGHPRRELLRHRLGGVPQRLLRRGLRRLRRGDGDRRREAQGLRVLRARRVEPRPTTAPAPTVTAPASFSLLAPAYAKKYGVDADEMKDVLTRIAWKNHRNGALNPRAQFRKEVSKETIACSPLVAGPLGIFDCSGVSDGSAAAIIVRAEDAHRYTDHPLYVKALSFIAGPAAGPIDPSYDYTTFTEVVRSAEDAYAQAGIERPPRRAGDGRGARLLHADRAGADGGPRVRRAGLRLEGGARRHVRPRRRAAGQPRRRPEVVRPPDRRLRAAHAVRVLDAAARRGRRAPDRQHRRAGKRKALTHNLGGGPGACVSFVSVVGDELDA